MGAEGRGIIVDDVDDFYPENSETQASESSERCGVGSLVLRQMMTQHCRQGQMAHEPMTRPNAKNGKGIQQFGIRGQNNSSIRHCVQFNYTHQPDAHTNTNTNGCFYATVNDKWYKRKKKNK